MKNARKIVLLILGLAIWLGPSDGFTQKTPKGDKDKKDKKEKTETGKKAEAIDPKTRERITLLFIDAETQYLQGNFPESINLFQQVIMLDPQNSASYFNIAKIYLETNDADNAVNYGKQALDLDGENYWFYHQLAKAYEQKQDHAKMAEVLEKMVKQFPQDYEARFDLAEAYIQMNKFPNALDQYNQLEKLTGLNEDVIYRKYQLYLYSKDADHALQEIEKLVKAFPGDKRHLKAKYDVLMMKGDNAAALKVLEDMVKENPDDGFALLSLADYYQSKGELNKSDEYLFAAFRSNSLPLESKLQIIAGMFPAASTDMAARERMNKLMKIVDEQHAGSPKVYGIRGDVFQLGGQLDSARFYYRKSVDAEPENDRAWEQLLNLDASARDYKSLVDDAEKALEYFPNNVDFLFSMGTGNVQLKKHEEAIYAFEKVKKLSGDPSLVSAACIQLGGIFHETGQFLKSDENFEAALAKFPNNALALNNYAWFLSLRGEKLDKAEEMVVKALKIEPDNSSYLDTYGWVLYKKADYKKAEELLAKALAADPNSAEVMEHYGDVLFKLGERDRAIEFWKKAQSHGATNLVIEEKLTQGD